MKAAVIEKQGGIENISYRDFPDPKLGPGDILVRNKAVGLNYFDIFVRRGMPGLPVPMPWISGADAAGEIAAVGSEVRGWKVGDRCLIDPLTSEGMMGEEVQGAFAEFCRIPAEFVIPLDPRLIFCRSRDHPGQLWHDLPDALHQWRLSAGRACAGPWRERWRRYGHCSGGQGLWWLRHRLRRQRREMRQAHGARRRPRDQLQHAGFLARGLAIERQEGVDVCVNFTGGDTWNPSIRTLKPHGKLLTCGATAGFDAQTDIRYIWQREVKICGSNGYTKEDVRRGMIDMADGKIKPPETKTFPLAQLGEAERAMETRDFFGKIV